MKLNLLELNIYVPEWNLGVPFLCNICRTQTQKAAKKTLNVVHSIQVYIYSYIFLIPTENLMIKFHDLSFSPFRRHVAQFYSQLLNK